MGDVYLPGVHVSVQWIQVVYIVQRNVGQSVPKKVVENSIMEVIVTAHVLRSGRSKPRRSLLHRKLCCCSQGRRMLAAKIGTTSSLVTLHFHGSVPMLTLAHNEADIPRVCAALP